MNKLGLICIFSTMITFGAWGQCLSPALNPSGPVEPGEDVAIEFEPVEGASSYRVEARDPFDEGWRTLGSTQGTIFGLPSFSFASTHELQIRIIPENSGEIVSCVGQLSVEYQADPELRSEFGRVVIPVAGSLEGAHGSEWRTMLSLSNTRTKETLSGNIIFHPAGAIGTDQDPSIRYRLEPGEVEQWSDIVGSLGATGLGTLDIVPDENVAGSTRVFGGYLPAIQARVVNLTENATFGTNVEAVPVRDLAPPQARRFHNGVWNSAAPSRGLGSTIIVPLDYGQTRLNIGFRYFGFHDLYWLQPLDPQGTPFVQLALRRGDDFIESVFREAPPGYMEQVPAEEIFTSQLLPGDVIIVRTVSALAYWTITDNDTNDPAFYFDVYPGSSKQIVFE